MCVGGQSSYFYTHTRYLDMKLFRVYEFTISVIRASLHKGAAA